MAHSTTLALVIVVVLALTFGATVSVSAPVNKSCVSGSAGASVSIGYGGARASAGAGVSLGADAYRSTCPRAEEIIRAAVERAVAADPRMAASLLRLHFHDCFVNGCDGSVLLDDKPFFIGEKTAVPNANSIRGFEVIDAIKTELERECPDTVSCADLLAIAARDSVVVSGGPSWEIEVGRKDSRTASRTDVWRRHPRAEVQERGPLYQGHGRTLRRAHHRESAVHFVQCAPCRRRRRLGRRRGRLQGPHLLAVAAAAVHGVGWVRAGTPGPRHPGDLRQPVLHQPALWRRSAAVRPGTGVVGCRAWGRGGRRQPRRHLRLRRLRILPGLRGVHAADGEACTGRRHQRRGPPELPGGEQLRIKSCMLTLNYLVVRAACIADLLSAKSSQ
uniref:Peroxidase n=1 Tax=Zea mays TaxID=4577 RepID=C0PPA8_MAIZE|nr:unknown [Zea mays]